MQSFSRVVPMYLETAIQLGFGRWYKLVMVDDIQKNPSKNSTTSQQERQQRQQQQHKCIMHTCCYQLLLNSAIAVLKRLVAFSTAIVPCTLMPCKLQGLVRACTVAAELLVPIISRFDIACGEQYILCVVFLHAHHADSLPIMCTEGMPNFGVSACGPHLPSAVLCASAGSSSLMCARCAVADMGRQRC
jgi:hypothetical protein